MSDLDMDLRQGEQRLGPYRLIRPISAGGMARVYEGRLDSLAGVSTRVAVKVIHPAFAADPGFQELFVAEARVSARLEHLNLVRVQQFNREGELLYLVMEFIEGFTLRKLISHARRNQMVIPTAMIAEIGRQVCEGLHYAHTLADEEGHGLGLVHRDIKPSNLMVNLQGVVKVLDFGISAASGRDEPQPRDGVKGTWGYMSLEQAHGDAVGPGADIFGLGAVLFELATGEALFPERENEVIRIGLIKDEAARRAATSVRADLAPVLIRALQRDPAARYTSAAALGRALAALVGDPLVAHEGLVQLATELRSQEGSVQAGAQERIRSVSTIGTSAPPQLNPRAEARRPVGLPVSVGDAHGPRVERRPPPRPKRRPSLLWAGALASFGLAAVVIMAFASWQLYRSASSAPPATSVPPDLSVLADPRGAAPTTPPPAAPTTAPSHPAPPSLSASAPAVAHHAEPDVAVRIPVAPQPPAPTAVAIPPAAPVSAPVAVVTGYLSIGSEPAADVLIDGSFVKRTPMLRYSIAAGTHTVKLIAAGSDPKTFKVTVVGGQEARKIWNFEGGNWVDE